jgi:putative transcriptional regulator
MTKLGQDLIRSAKEALAIARGEIEPARVVESENVDVATIRKRLGLSQARFAAKFGLSPATVRDWEQGRRRPDRTARTLLLVIEKNPRAVEDALT